MISSPMANLPSSNNRLAKAKWKYDPSFEMLGLEYGCEIRLIKRFSLNRSGRIFDKMNKRVYSQRAFASFRDIYLHIYLPVDSARGQF